MSETHVASFIIRVTYEQGTDSAGRRVGLVRHVQSGAEQRFIDLSQAFQFIERLTAPRDEQDSAPSGGRG